MLSLVKTHNFCAACAWENGTSGYISSLLTADELLGGKTFFLKSEEKGFSSAQTPNPIEHEPDKLQLMLVCEREKERLWSDGARTFFISFAS